MTTACFIVAAAGWVIGMLMGITATFFIIVYGP